MSIRSRLVEQFRQPHGALGVLVGRLMAQRSSNRQRSTWTVDLLDVQPNDRVLELGYGPGLGIEAALVRLRTGTIVGLDHSETMRTMATKRLRRVPRHVQPDLRIGDAEAFPNDLGTFDKVFSCNVWLFWKEPIAVFERLREHLAPGGTVAVAHLPRQRDATRNTTVTAGDRISAQLARAGYVDVRRHMLELDAVPAVCVLATRPDPDRPSHPGQSL